MKQRKTLLDSKAFEQLEKWVVTDARTASKILKLIRETAKTPFHGKGKPEPLNTTYKANGPEESPRNTGWCMK